MVCKIEQKEVARKSTSFLLYPPRISHEVTRDWTRGSPAREQLVDRCGQNAEYRIRSSHAGSYECCSPYEKMATFKIQSVLMLTQVVRRHVPNDSTLHNHYRRTWSTVNGVYFFEEGTKCLYTVYINIKFQLCWEQRYGWVSEEVWILFSTKRFKQ